MTELFCHIMRRDVPAEGPLVDRSAGVRVDHRKIFVTYSQANAVGVSIEMMVNQVFPSKRCRHENIGFAAASDQTGYDGLPIANHVLRGRGFVVHIAGVDVGAMIQKEFRNLDAGGKMQRRLTVAATSM